MSKISYEDVYRKAWSKPIALLGDNANKLLGYNDIKQLCKPSVITIQSEDTKREIAEANKRIEDENVLFEREQEFYRKVADNADNIYNSIYNSLW